MPLTQVNPGLLDTQAQYTGFKNRIINGAMVIDQRNAGASVTPTTTQYTLDRWLAEIGGVASKYSVRQNAGSVTPPAGFSNYLGITSTSAYTPGPTDNFSLQHRFEGFNTADLAWGTANAKAVTLSFWVRSSLTGTFGGEIFVNGSTARAYPYNYTISSANTWGYKTITIPGDTFTNTIPSTNSFSLILVFMLGAGSSTLSSSPNVWQTGNFLAPTGCVNVVATNGATWYVTGVQLEVGSTATSFDYRPYGTELQLCQRYCFVLRATPATGNFTPYFMAHGVNTTTGRGFLQYPQIMRSNPILSFSAANTFQWSFGNALSAISAAEIGASGGSIDWTSTGIAANGGYLITSANNQTSFIIASAEL